jgi:phosphoglycolate phosphatase
MVGDTNFDVLGAAAHQIPTIGVTWGYGDLTELKEAGPIALADNPEELYQRIHEFSR